MTQPHAQHGFYLLEMIVVLTVLVSLMGLGSRSITKNAELTVNNITAQQLKQVTRAAREYLQDHYQLFIDDPSKTLKWQDLVDNGYLTGTLPSQNHYGQSYQFTVTEHHTLLQLLLTTDGGHPINESSLRQIAAMAGSSAGYASVLHNNKIVGHQESWSLNDSSLNQGHLASLTFVNEQEVMDAANFLRRTSFPGHPEYNQMHTDLLMMANTIKMDKDNKAAKLNKDGLVFNDTTSKGIGMFNTDYPNITIQDDTLPVPSTLKINSADLNFTKGTHDIHVGVDTPQIVIKNKDLGWSTELKPSEIRLESTQSGNRSYVGNDMFYLTNKNNEQSLLNASQLQLVEGDNSVIIDARTVYTSKVPEGKIGTGVLVNHAGTFSSISKEYIKIPYYELSVGSTWIHERLPLCGSKETEGRLFLVGEVGKSKRRLAICGNGKSHSLDTWE